MRLRTAVPGAPPGRGSAAAGIAVTAVEAAIFALLVRSGSELFKRILPIVR